MAIRIARTSLSPRLGHWQPGHGPTHTQPIFLYIAAPGLTLSIAADRARSSPARKPSVGAAARGMFQMEHKESAGLGR